MANSEDSDIDDDFSDLYKEYTGPPRLYNTTTVPETAKTSKRSHSGSDEEEEPVDPNAVPTGFISRDAKVWDAKSKATEKNWKKRKEEEMICKLCGESSHYTQGCPSTLGANRKSQDLFQRVPARDPLVKALFTDTVIMKIENDIGCKIKMEEKFLIVSGKDGKILSMGVDTVHKIKNEANIKNEADIKNEANIKSESDFNTNKSMSPRGRSPRNTSHYNQRSGRHDTLIEEHKREEFQKYPRGSPQAYGTDGNRSRSTHSKSPARPPYTRGSKSPARPPYTRGSYGVNDNHNQNRAIHRNEERDAEKRRPDLQSTFSQTLEELELEYKRDATDIGRIRDKEEDEENYRHRKAVRETRENYMQRLAIMRESHAKQWDEFLQFDTRRRQQQTRQQMPSSGFSGYKHNNYDHGNNSNNMPVESRIRNPEPENYPPLRSNNNYEDFQHQHQRREDYRETYNRY